ncbi:MAG: hypothetical protein J7K62_03265 [Thermoplasmata archaeon]|nr:hypothetical protein [Thermoplasmata archaeon]
MILADDFSKYSEYVLVGGIGKKDFLLIGSYAIIWKGLSKGYSLNQISHEFNIPLKIVHTRTQEMLKYNLVDREVITSKYINIIAKIDNDRRGRIKYTYKAVGYEKRGFESPYIDTSLLSVIGIITTSIIFIILKNPLILFPIMLFFILLIMSIYQNERFCLKT